MGLDMSLYRKMYVKKWGHQPPDEQYSVLVKRGGKVCDDINPDKISEIVEDVGYWRKANQIHKWFVENVQDGEDDCKEYYVSTDKMKELRDLCKRVLDASELVDSVIENGQTIKEGVAIPNIVRGKVIKDPTVAKELLPTADGFFFGSTDYNEYYIEDLKTTLEILDPILAIENDRGNYYYSSSW